MGQCMTDQGPSPVRFVMGKTLIANHMIYGTKSYQAISGRGAIFLASVCGIENQPRGLDDKRTLEFRKTLSEAYDYFEAEFNPMGGPARMTFKCLNRW